MNLELFFFTLESLITEYALWVSDYAAFPKFIFQSDFPFFFKNP